MIDQPPQLVDEAAHQRQRDRAAAGYARHDFLKKAVAERVVDRLDAVRREFPLVADIGCHGGQLAQMLMDHPRNRPGAGAGPVTGNGGGGLRKRL